MCQAIVDGGRRCDVHRSDSLLTFAVLKAKYPNFNDDVIEKAFTLIKKTVASVSVGNENGEGEDNSGEYSSFMREMVDQLDTIPSNLRHRYRNIVNDLNLNNPPSRRVFEALKTLSSKLELHNEALLNQVREVASLRGLPNEQVLEEYLNLRDSIDVGRNSEIPSEYTTVNRDAAAAKNLPTDKASVVAMVRLWGTVVPRTVDSRFVSLSERTGGLVVAGGYDPERANGLVELVFEPHVDRVYSYQNIPQSTWDSFTGAVEEPNGLTPYEVYLQNIRPGLFETAVDAERGASIINCESCGQFRGETHVCPVRDRVEQEGYDFSGEIGEPASESDLVDGSLGLELWERELLGCDIADRPIFRLNEETGLFETVEYDDSDSVDVTEVETGADESLNSEGTGSAPVLSVDEIFVSKTSAAFREAFPNVTLIEVDGDVDEDGLPNYQLTGFGDDTVFVTTFANIERLDVREYQGNKILFVEPVSYNTTVGVDDARQVSNEGTNTLSAASDNLPIILHASEYLSSSYVDQSVFGVSGRILEGANNTLQTFIAGPQTRWRWRAVCGSVPLNVSHSISVEDAEASYAASGLAEIVEGATVLEGNSSFRNANGFYPNVTVDNREMSFGLKVRTAPLRAIENGLANGGVITVPVNWVAGSNDSWRSRLRRQVLTDDAGNVLRLNDVNSRNVGFEVSGNVTLRRNEAGEIEVISSPVRSLKCECVDYRNKYYCAHTNHVNARFGRFLTGSFSSGVQTDGVVSVNREAATSGSAGPAVRRRRAARGELPVALADLNPTLTRSEGETGSITRAVFSEFPSSRRSRASFSTSDTYNLASSAVEYDDSEGSLTSSLMNVLGLNDFRRFQSTLNANQIRRALAVSPEVEIRLNVDSHFSFREAGLQGRIVFERGPDGRPAVKSSTIINRCSCGRFISANGGFCSHELAFNNAGSELLFPSTVDMARVPNDSYNSTSSNRLRTAQGLLRAFSSVNVSEELLSTVEEGSTEYQTIQSSIETARELWANPSPDAVEVLDRLGNSIWEISRGNENRSRYVDSRSRNPQIARNADEYRQARRSAWEEWDTYPKLTEADHESLVAQLEQFRDTDPRETMEFITENATHGICDPNVEGSRRFGVELEYVSSDDSVRTGSGAAESLGESIAQALHASGISETNRFLRWHGVKRDLGYRSWGNEHDASVHGEVVSPIMSDTPEYWEQVRKACEAITSNGGTTNHRVGSHVHISSSSFEADTAKHVEAVRLTQMFGSVLYRVGTSPDRKVHRNEALQGSGVTNYSRPVKIDSSNDLTFPSKTVNPTVTNSLTSHNYMCNTSGSGGFSNSDNIEYRVWDGSLDPKFIQMNVIISAFLTEHAEKNVEQKGNSEPVDVSKYRLNGNVEPVAGDPSTTAVLRDFLNLFPDERIRSNIIKMFGSSRWVNVSEEYSL